MCECVCGWRVGVAQEFSVFYFFVHGWELGGGVDKSLFFYLFLFSKSRSRELLTPSLPQPVKLPG